jgi:hypothetical protein
MTGASRSLGCISNLIGLIFRGHFKRPSVFQNWHFFSRRWTQQPVLEIAGWNLVFLRSLVHCPPVLKNSSNCCCYVYFRTVSLCPWYGDSPHNMQKRVGRDQRTAQCNGLYTYRAHLKIPACSPGYLLGLYFEPEDEGDMFLQNVWKVLPIL